MTDKRHFNPGRPKEWTDERIEEEARALVEWMNDDESRLWLKDFALERGYCPSYLNKLADQNEIFSEAIKTAKGIQESRTYQGAITGILNPTMAIFGLKNNHGWKDTHHTENKNEHIINPSGALADLLGRLGTAGDSYTTKGSDG
jgi:hypothetical protein